MACMRSYSRSGNTSGSPVTARLCTAVAPSVAPTSSMSGKTRRSHGAGRSRRVASPARRSTATGAPTTSPRMAGCWRGSPGRARIDRHRGRGSVATASGGAEQQGAADRRDRPAPVALVPVAAGPQTQGDQQRTEDRPGSRHPGQEHPPDRRHQQSRFEPKTRHGMPERHLADRENEPLRGWILRGVGRALQHMRAIEVSGHRMRRIGEPVVREGVGREQVAPLVDRARLRRPRYGGVNAEVEGGGERDRRDRERRAPRHDEQRVMSRAAGPSERGVAESPPGPARRPRSPLPG